MASTHEDARRTDKHFESCILDWEISCKLREWKLMMPNNTSSN